MNVTRESLGEMNDTDGQGNRIDDGTRVHSKFVQWRSIPDRSLKESLELQGGGDQDQTSILKKSLST